MSEVSVDDHHYQPKCSAIFRFCTGAWVEMCKKRPLFLIPESDMQLILTESCLAWQHQLLSVTVWTLSQAFSLMTLQRWEKVAAQKDLESKGGIDPGTRPSFLSLTPASSSPSLPLHLSLCQFVSSPPLPIFLSPCLSPCSCIVRSRSIALMLGSGVPGQRSQQWVRAYNFFNLSARARKQHNLHYPIQITAIHIFLTNKSLSFPHNFLLKI